MEVPRTNCSQKKLKNGFKKGDFVPGNFTRRKRFFLQNLEINIPCVNFSHINNIVTMRKLNS
jgi:hypothetical protein